MTDAALFRCRLSGWLVQPISTEPISAGGVRFIWWTCPACDCDERPRTDANYDAAHPGVHCVQLTQAPVPRAWRGREVVQ